MPSRDAAPTLVPLVVVEPPDPHVDEAVSGAFSGAEERFELPHADVGSTMRQRGKSEAPVELEVLELRPDGVYLVMWGRAAIDIVGLRISSRFRGPMSLGCGGLGYGGGMASLSGAARLPGGGVPPKVLSRCLASKFSVEARVSGSAGLGCVVGGGVAPGSSCSECSIISSCTLCSVPPEVPLWFCRTVSVE